jgi:hypothetical protein
MIMNQVVRIIFLVAFVLFTSAGIAQQKIIRPDLTANKLLPVNRHLKAVQENGKTIVLVDSAPGAGIVWIEGLNFSEGTIDLEIRGRDVLQKSFTGIAFHGINDSTYEAVYFRPFNFLAEDTVRKKHAIQYLAVPKFDWPYLREKYPDQYEAPIPFHIDPNSWFHVKLVVVNKRVEVYLGQSSRPALVVESLQILPSGKIGFWVGNNSEGEFRDLVISVR